MVISRDFTKIINYILDNLLPPILRDCYWLMYPIYRVACGRDAAKLLQYKDKFPYLDEKGYNEYYELAAKTLISQRPTDLNNATLNFILNNIESGENVLDVGCGRGYLAKEIAKISNNTENIIGLDIEKPLDTEGYKFVQGSITKIPFPDKSFDKVTCSHVLEHVVDFAACFSELVRVAKKKLIIVLPRQREYRYLADLHVRFFPYEYNIRTLLPTQFRDSKIQLIGGDWGVIIDLA
ncbi:MAG: class I SAM-dependent methyltransferase [Synergistaceae bacterium]|nr:class I SAM-dependent methyltransferase [Synergistaceae bacterium]